MMARTLQDLVRLYGALPGLTGHYGPYGAAVGIVTDHIGLALESGCVLVLGGTAGAALRDENGNTIPVLCGELIEIYTEDGRGTGRCGRPVHVGDGRGAGLVCPLHG